MSKDWLNDTVLIRMTYRERRAEERIIKCALAWVNAFPGIAAIEHKDFKTAVVLNRAVHALAKLRKEKK